MSIINPEFILPLFGGRRDVYALSCEINGKPAFRPVHEPLTAEVILKHQAGDILIGIYPLDLNGRANFLAIDFDNHHGETDPMEDIKTFLETHADKKLPFYVEKSKSGMGYHLWLFFEEYIDGNLVYEFARKLMAACPGKLKSYDRFFPTQRKATGPKALGNLIALPFYGKSVRLRKGSFFVNNETFEPLNQENFLSHIDLVPIEEVILLESSIETSQGFEGGDQLTNPEVVLNCEYIKFSKENSSSLKEPQWWAMIAVLSKFKNSEALIHEYSKSHKSYSHSETEFKIKASQNAKSVPSCSYLRSLAPSINCLNCPVYEAQKTPISLAFQESANAPRTLKDHVISLLKPAEGPAKYLKAGRLFFDHMVKNGAAFYLDAGGILYGIIGRRPMRMDMTNPAFASFIFRESNMVKSDNVTGKFTDVIKNLAYESAFVASDIYWHLLRVPNLYLNIGNGNVLKIGESIKYLENGRNDEKVFLRDNDMRPFEFLADPNIDFEKSIEGLFIKNFTCEESDSYVVVAWALASFFLLAFTSKAGMKFSGTTASGKTTAARFLSHLIYGRDELAISTVAAQYTSGAINPMTIMDNYEDAMLSQKDISYFLLTSVTGISKHKRTMGTDTSVTKEKVITLPLVTAIDPFDKSEVTNRFYEIEFSKGRKRKGFMESEVIIEIEEKREAILSEFLKRCQPLIKEFDKKIKERLKWLHDTFPGHPKNRTFEFLSLIVNIMEMFAGPKTNAMVAEFLERQSKQTDADIKSYSVIREYFKNAFAEHAIDSEGFSKNFGIEMKSNGVGPYMELSTGDLFKLMSSISKLRGMKQPYKSAIVLGKRLNEDLEDGNVNGIEVKKIFKYERLHAIHVKKNLELEDL